MAARFIYEIRHVASRNRLYNRYDSWIMQACSSLLVHEDTRGQKKIISKPTCRIQAYSRDREEILEGGQRWALILLGIGLFDTFGTLFFVRF